MSTDNDENLTPQDELSALKARADMLKISYHPSIGLEKLREKVNAALAADGPVAPDTPENSSQPPADTETKTETQTNPEVAAAPAKESDGEKRARLKREANELVRIRVTCMNPAKKDWKGEIFTVGNSLVGSFKKYVPFNADDGWHVPRIILKQIQERQCQIFVNEATQGGVTKRKGKMIKEFAVEILPPLTQKELDELARRQAMAKGQS